LVPAAPTTDFEVAGEIKAQRITLEEPIVTVITGSVLIWLTATPPEGYLECDGSAISRTEYASLFEVIGTSFGEGDGSTTFNLPDFRGQFLRGWDHGAGVDPDAGERTNRGDGTTGDNVGTKQGDKFKAHTHGVKQYRSGSSNGQIREGTGSYKYPWGGVTTVQSQATGSSETRPKNINVMYIIKY
jgi:microcystin-dependent protein